MSGCSSATVSHILIYFYLNVLFGCGGRVGGVTRGDLRCSPNVFVAQKMK